MRADTRGVVFHAALILALLALFMVLIAATPPESGANIGAGLVGLPLMILGVPWSLPALINPYRFDHWSNAAHYALWFGPAVVNVALHAVVVAVQRNRRQR